VPNITSEIHFVVQLLTCTQPTHALQNISDGSENLFRTVENCVYFAVRVLYNIRNFLTALDTATLQLLSDNTRIKQLEPKLAAFLSVALERAQTDVSSRGQSHVVPQSALTNNRVPFQEDTDNLRNFPNMKVFHAFKKQRDSFYSILREWEANHNMPHWSFQSALRDKIRTLMSQPPELCSLDHLATLFQRQLMESCSYAAHLCAGMERLAEGPLKNLNPDKLMKLSERFQRQPHVSTGTCPPATFSESEQFFSSFVTSADSYTFNCHLTTALHHELLKLHGRCGTVATREVPAVLHALRVCGKFLGYLDFLPYTTSVCTSLLQARTASPHTLLVSRCVNEAVEREHISLTIPWAVDYMSMIDSHALQVPQVHSLLCQMVAIYRSTLLEGGSVTADSFLVLACLGWLLETPNVSSSVFFQCLKSDGFQPSKLPQSELVTRDLLYICCPYLACIRVTLAEFASGLQSKTSPIRKIKPVPAGPDTTHTQSSPVSPLQLKLQENFFRNHPPLFKQLCDTVSERVSETAVQRVQSEIVPEHVRSGLQSLALWIGQSCSDQPGSGSCISLEKLFHRSEAVRKVAQVREQTFSCALKEATQFCRGHSEANTSRAMSALVCATIPKQVLTVAIGIAVDWSIERCMKWINSKLRGIATADETEHAFSLWLTVFVPRHSV
jgi:codanin-1